MTTDRYGEVLPERADPIRQARRSLGKGLIVGGLFLLASQTLRLLVPDYLSLETVKRILGVLMGAFVIGYANAAPKALSPLSTMRCDPTAEQEKRRFVAWSLTLGGIAYTGAWLVAPFEIANQLSMGLLATSLLLAIARAVKLRTKGPRV